MQNLYFHLNSTQSLDHINAQAQTFGRLRITQKPFYFLNSPTWIYEKCFVINGELEKYCNLKNYIFSESIFINYFDFSLFQTSASILWSQQSRSWKILYSLFNLSILRKLWRKKKMRDGTIRGILPVRQKSRLSRGPPQSCSAAPDLSSSGSVCFFLSSRLAQLWRHLRNFPLAWAIEWEF